MTITCTCGHEVSDINQVHSVIETGYDKLNERCLIYKTVCTACYVEGDWIADEELGYKWLTSSSETV